MLVHQTASLVVSSPMPLRWQHAVAGRLKAGLEIYLLDRQFAPVQDNALQCHLLQQLKAWCFALVQVSHSARSTYGETG